jgi:holo-[acyl-carrier protein] synthase
MIVGTGVDLTEVHRIAETIQRYGDRFLNRVFTPEEIRYCQSKRNFAERFAGRFAAKEAAMKAIGTGVSRGVTWTSVEVARQPQGRPTIVFSGMAQEIANQLGVRRVSLSLSHTADLAIAHVILED